MCQQSIQSLYGKILAWDVVVLQCYAEDLSEASEDDLKRIHNVKKFHILITRHCNSVISIKSLNNAGSIKAAVHYREISKRALKRFYFYHQVLWFELNLPKKIFEHLMSLLL